VKIPEGARAPAAVVIDAMRDNGVINAAIANNVKAHPTLRCCIFAPGFASAHVVCRLDCLVQIC
jgi:hypothetical protein